MWRSLQTYQRGFIILLSREQFPEMLIVIILLLNILLTVYVAAFINKGKQSRAFFFFLHLKPVLVSEETFLEGSHLVSDVYVEWHLTALDYTCVLIGVSRLLLLVRCRATQGFWGDSEPADNQTCTGQIHINHSFRGTENRLLMVHPEKQKMNI